MLEVKNLCKAYPTFQLKNVSFNLEEGEIVGFLGQNGAGKTTTLKCIMQAVVPDAGEISVDGISMKEQEQQVKQMMSFTTGIFDYYRNEKLKKIAKVYKTFYSLWDEQKFLDFCKQYNLDLNKRVKELSAGMKTKFALALALSHGAKYFIFDEPTSGLDPIARDELLDVFRETAFEGHGILFSTHITSDLDKCADKVLLIRNGEILLTDGKDNLLESHVVIKGDVDQLTDDLKSRVIGYKSHSFGFTALIRREKLQPSEKFATEKPTLDDVMVYYNREAE